MDGMEGAAGAVEGVADAAVEAPEVSSQVSSDDTSSAVETAPGTTPEPEFATLEDLEELVSKRGGKVRIKANGKEQDVSWDEAKRYLPLGRGAHQRFEEAQSALEEARGIQAQAEALAQLVTTQPETFLRRLSPELQEQYIRGVAALLKDEQASPEERERSSRDRELEELRRYRAEREQQEQSTQQSQLEAQAYETIQRQFAGAMDKAQVSADPAYRTEVMRRMAGLQRETMRRGAQPLDPDDLLEIARSEVREPARSVVGGMTDEELEEFLGAERLKKLAQRRIAKVQSPQQSVTGARSVRGNTGAEPAAPIRSTEDFTRFLDSRSRR